MSAADKKIKRNKQVNEEKGRDSLLELKGIIDEAKEIANMSRDTISIVNKNIISMKEKGTPAEVTDKLESISSAIEKELGTYDSSCDRMDKLSESSKSTMDEEYSMDMESIHIATDVANSITNISTLMNDLEYIQHQIVNPTTGDV